MLNLVAPCTDERDEFAISCSYYWLQGSIMVALSLCLIRMCKWPEAVPLQRRLPQGQLQQHENEPDRPVATSLLISHLPL